MHTILLTTLISQLQAAHARGAQFTNVEAVDFHGGNTVTFDSETSADDLDKIAELEEKITELKLKLVDAEDESAAAAGEAQKFESRVIELENEIGGIRDDTDTSLLEYKRRAELAEKAARDSRNIASEWKNEVEFLRKRKGVTANYFKMQSEIFRFIRANCESGNSEAKRILEQLNAPSSPSGQK